MKTCHNRFLWVSLFLSLLIAASAASAAEQRKIVPQAKTPAANLSVETGRYYAIVIGINEYKHLPRLQTAKKDAEDVARILREKFGFETRLLLDATRHEIVDSVNQARALLRENDNFLLYYAGHGEFDKTTEKAFWLPADARPDSDAEWIIADTITSNIKRFTAKHVLIIADSCYSGTMTRKAVTSLASSEERAVHLRKMSRKNSRTLMASGGNEPVADTGGEGHSIFASVFLRALAGMEEPAFTAERLFDEEIKVAVSGRAEQTPEYHDIRNSGHDGGDFVFVARTEPAGPPGGGGNGLNEERRKLEAERARIEEERKKLEEEKQKLARLQEGTPAPVPEKEKKADEKTASLPPAEPKAKPTLATPSLEDMTAKILAARGKPAPPESEQLRKARELYETGEKYFRSGTQRDAREALSWYRQAADQGYAPAMKKTGDSYAFGWGGMKVNAREAMKWYRQAAEKGDPDGFAAIGALYLSGVGDTPRDPAEAMIWYRKAASAGSVGVLYYIGHLYWGSMQDEREAMKWFKKAADLGSVEALYSIGIMQKDPAEGIRWHKKAIDAGYIPSVANVGYLYEGYLDESSGIRDLSEAVKWYKKAADLGYVRAYAAIGYTYVRYPERRDVAEAVKWFSKAGELGLGDGYYQIGNMYRYGGDGAVKVDYGEAMKWFKKAVEVGDGMGSWAVGTLYRDGNGVAKDYGEAARWFRKAVEENSGWSFLASDLGDMYKTGGPGLARDIEQARVWYRKYAEVSASHKERAEKKLAELK